MTFYKGQLVRCVNAGLDERFFVKGVNYKAALMDLHGLQKDQVYTIRDPDFFWPYCSFPVVRLEEITRTMLLNGIEGPFAAPRFVPIDTEIFRKLLEVKKPVDA